MLSAPWACTTGGDRGPVAARTAVYPPPPQPPQVVALGNLRSGRPPTQAEIELATFLFGAEPQPPLGLIKPLDLAALGRDLLIVDSSLNAMLRWGAERDVLDELELSPRPGRPSAVRFAPDGDLLVADADGRAVLRYDARGALRRTYAQPGDAFRPADVLSVGDELWVSNIAAHRIDVFDATTGRRTRSIGRPGSAPAEFRVPLGLALTPAGDVLAVDMLNARVQALAADGRWLREIGGPGDRVGTFGRPKDVAVGPDGTVFATDAASQRVHAFDPQGRPLLAFGGPESGEAGLLLPAGIAITREPPMTRTAPPGFEPAYYVLVCEQLRDPGIRVFAWRGARGSRDLLQAGGQSLAAARRNAAGTLNPHWSAEDCGACHAMVDLRPTPIAPEKVDALCLSCHDGKAAGAEAHPIGRLASGPGLATPAAWPLNAGRLTCLTCHDILRHCEAGARRPAENPALVRGFDPSDRTASCRHCHTSAEPWRVNPHRQLTAAGDVDADSCTLCHNAKPEPPADGRRPGQPDLRLSGSALCLTCHARHWDYAPGGHVDRLVSARMRDRLAGRRLLPLSDERVACYTCHNPHQPGLFPGDSPLGCVARTSQDAELLLRMDQLELCTECHIP